MKAAPVLFLFVVVFCSVTAGWACEDCGPSCTACVCGCGGEDRGGGLGFGNTAGGSASFNAKNVELLSRLSLAEIGAPNANQRGSAIWGWADPLTNREYALYGLSNGTSFIDVTDARNPVYLGMMPTATGDRVWREVQTYGNYLYVVSDANGAHGMQVFDLTRLRGKTAPQTWTADFRYTNVNNVHTISINESTGFAYLNGSNLGQHVVNLAKPLSPTATVNYPSGYVHDALIVTYNGPDTRFTGREIALNSQANLGLRVVDFTNKTSPTLISSTVYADLGYTHQGWLTEDQAFFIMNDEFDESNDVGDPTMRTETHVWDVRDLTAPRYLGAFRHDTRVIDHNLFIKGDRVFMSNYTAGLRVFDIGDLYAIADGPRNADGTAVGIQEAFKAFGFFDTYPGDDLNPETSFNGQWGNYPFLPSGNILAGDRNNGLFVLRLSASAAPEPASSSLMLLGIGVYYLRFRRRDCANKNQEAAKKPR